VRKLLIVLLAGCLLPVAVSAQFKVSFEGNGQWLTKDVNNDVFTNNDDTAKIRANAYLKLDYTIKNWDFGVQFESYLPQALLNYSPDLKEINVGALYVRYNNISLGLDVTAGHIYEQLGSGLIFRSWEDRQLGLNNAIFGGRIAYTPVNGLKLTILGGKQRIGMGFDFSDGAVAAANLETSITDIFKVSDFDANVGFSYVGRYEDKQELYPDLPTMLNAYSARFYIAKSGFYLGGEYVFKGKDPVIDMRGQINSDALNTGNAQLINMGYAKKGLGIDVNLRRMENMGFYSQQNLARNKYNTGVLNYLPALTKQYTSSLQNIYIYQAQPFFQYEIEKVGEIGGQIDLFYEFKKGSLLGGKYGTNVALNASYWGSLNAKTDFDTKTYSADLFSVDVKYYHDIGMEVRKRCTKDLSFVLIFLNQFYNLMYLEAKPGIVNTNIITGEATYKFGKAQSVKLQAGHHWADAGYKNWAGGALEYALNYNWSFFVSDDYNYGNDDEEERKHYYNAGITFVTGSIRVAAGYGKQRAGTLCAGGVCRMVSEATGFNLALTASF
jgi:hypothetical protein